VQLNVQDREITIKIVYYGPALSGKTTNLTAIHSLVEDEHRGKLITLDTQDDRTIFFDLLPIHFKASGNLLIKVKLFTVPGQVVHDSTRRVVLAGADGVAFIADAQHSKKQDNIDSFNNLKKNLKLNGFDPESMPMVVQFNKLDLPDTQTKEEIEESRRRSSHPVYPAVAIQGKGVIKTLAGLIALTWEELEKKHSLEDKFGITRTAFLENVLSCLKMKDIKAGI